MSDEDVQQSVVKAGDAYEKFIERDKSLQKKRDKDMNRIISDAENKKAEQLKENLMNNSQL